MKKIINILAILLFANQLQAQVNKEVEVTKTYIPTVLRAEKPLLDAPAIDTATINPDIDYNVTPLSINTQLQTLPIKPATITYWEFNKPTLAQFKIGAGYPFNTLLQGYLASHNASVGYVAANIDHVGNFSKIKNDYNKKIDATQALNSGSISAGLYVGDRSLDGGVYYTNNIYNKYAFEQTKSAFLNYQKLGAALKFGDSFTNFDKFNFSIGGGYSYFTDRNSAVNNTACAEVAFGQEFSLGRLMFGADIKHVGSNYDYRSNIISANVSLDKIISKWQFALGVTYHHDRTVITADTKPKHYVTPKLLIRMAVPSAISPFIEANGFLQQNNYGSLSEINPFLNSKLSAYSGVEQKIAVGILGQTKSTLLSYKLDISRTMSFNNIFWALCIDSEEADSTDIYNNYFDIAQSKLNISAGNFEISYRPITNLSIALDAHYYNYETEKESPYVNSRPKYESTLTLDYIFSKVNFGINAHLIGERNFTINNYSPTSAIDLPTSISTLPYCVDLSIYATWKASDKLSIFIEGDNLCNADLYPWPNYKGYGLQFTAGVKINCF